MKQNVPWNETSTCLCLGQRNIVIKSQYWLKIIAVLFLVKLFSPRLDDMAKDLLQYFLILLLEGRATHAHADMYISQK